MSKKIRQGQEILYKYNYLMEENVGRWYEGVGLGREDGRELPRRCRQMCEYFDVLRVWWVESNDKLPMKSKSGESMQSQRSQYCSTRPCLYCCDHT